MDKIKDYIIVLDAILSHSLCDSVLAEYAETDEWKPTAIGGAGEIAPSIRSAMTINMSDDSVLEKNYSRRKQLDSSVFDSVSNAINQYNEKFSHCSIVEDSGYDLLRYETGQFYKEHVDSFKDRPRAVSCSLSLNDDYEGGEFAFFDEDLVLKAPKGSAVLFPSNFMYPHQILPVTSGTRYSIITWFI